MCYAAEKNKEHDKFGKGQQHPPQQKRSHVSLTMRVNNVDYSLLRSTPELHRAFVENVKTAIAASAGATVSAADVQVELSAGSVIIKADVHPPKGLETEQINDALAANKQITQKVTSAIEEVPGIESITSGQPSTALVSSPTVVLPSDANEEPAAKNQDKEELEEKPDMAMIIGAALGGLLVCSVILMIVAACWCGRRTCINRKGNLGSDAQSFKADSNPNISVNPAIEV